MSFAATLSSVSGALRSPAELQRTLMQKRWPLTMLWVAFLGGVTTTQIWLSHRAEVQPPQAVLAVDPTPLPLVAGEDPLDRPLVAAPLDGLEETTAEGRLPIIAPDGMMPLRAYAAPFNRHDPRPRVAIVLTDVGPQAAPLNEAIRRLPGAVDLAFSAHTPDLGKALAAAREAGHETMLAAPADRLDAALGDDPGPGALRRALSAGENMQRLRLMMGKGSGYIGLVLTPGTWPAEDSNFGGALLSEVQKRGLAVLSTSEALSQRGQVQGKLALTTTLALDRDLTPEGVSAALAELEQRSREMGQVIAISPAYPLVLEKLAEWLPTLSHRGIAVAPLSALIPEDAAGVPASGEGHTGEGMEPHAASAGHTPAHEPAPASENAHTPSH